MHKIIFRTFISPILLCTFFLLTFCNNPLSAQQPPNVVLILADDLDAVITPEFFPEVLPAVADLKKTSVNFTNSFVPISICCPSRAGILSGKMGHRTNVLNNGGAHGGWKQFIDDEPTALPALLSKSGYRTAMIGKYMNGYQYKGKKLPSIPYGWTDGLVHISPRLKPYKGYNYKMMNWQNGNKVTDTTWTANLQVKKYGRKESDYSTDVVTAKAKEFLKSTQQNPKQPFFLYLCPTAPHIPLPPAPRYEKITEEKWSNKPVPSTPNTFSDKGKLQGIDENKAPKDKPWWIRRNWAKHHRQRNHGGYMFNLNWYCKVPKHIKVFKDADYFNRMGSLYALNDMVREVVAGLKANNQWDNTVLIFTSDNGYQFGNHGLYQKGSPYEESIRVPLLITGGAALKLKQNVNLGDWVINHDLMPTILELAGVQVPPGLDGKSLKEYLSAENQNAPPLRDKFLLEYKGPGMLGELPRAYSLHFFILPSYFNDLPTYHAVRMKMNDKNGKETVYKYIEWERYPGCEKLREKIAKKNVHVLNLIKDGNKRMLKRVQIVNAVEKELYNITDDPYELDNLLYYKPQEFQPVADTIKVELDKMMKQ